MAGNSFTQKIGKRIAELRVSRRESQRSLADALGVKRETVKFWESGDRQIKSMDIIHIARHFDVSTDYLLGFSDIMMPEPNVRIMCDLTGLSETAAESFLFWSVKPDMERILNVIFSDEGWKECADALERVRYYSAWLDGVLPLPGSDPGYGADYMESVYKKLRFSRFDALDTIVKFVDKLFHYREIEERFNEVYPEAIEYDKRKRAEFEAQKLKDGSKNGAT